MLERWHLASGAMSVAHLLGCTQDVFEKLLLFTTITGSRSFDSQSLSCAFRESCLVKCMRVLTLGKKSCFSAAFTLRHVDTVIIFACRAYSKLE